MYLYRLEFAIEMLDSSLKKSELLYLSMIYNTLMVLYTELDDEFDKCPIKEITSIQDIEIIRDFYFTIIDKFDMGYNCIQIYRSIGRSVEDINNALLINCNRNEIFNLKFITKCIDYNKYCYYNITDFDKLMNDYENFINNNDTSFLEYWNEGNQEDSDRYDEHILKVFC